MKMSKESYDYIARLFQEHVDAIKQYAEGVRERGNYQDFYTRVGWEALRYVLHKDGNRRFIVDTLYDGEGLNDNHVTTAVRKALKAVNIYEEVA